MSSDRADGHDFHLVNMEFYDWVIFHSGAIIHPKTAERIAKAWFELPYRG